ncbi:hypothetical protein [Variovorax guangxiensis]|nr:hypothetical protein [Variovorax guangxiensis]
MTAADSVFFPGPLEHLTAFALVLFFGLTAGAALVWFSRPSAGGDIDI